jgi:hypothetical protein
MFTIHKRSSGTGAAVLQRYNEAPFRDSDQPEVSTGGRSLYICKLTQHSRPQNVLLHVSTSSLNSLKQQCHRSLIGRNPKFNSVRITIWSPLVTPLKRNRVRRLVRSAPTIHIRLKSCRNLGTLMPDRRRTCVRAEGARGSLIWVGSAAAICWRHRIYLPLCDRQQSLAEVGKRRHKFALQNSQRVRTQRCSYQGTSALQT